MCFYDIIKTIELNLGNICRKLVRNFDVYITVNNMWVDRHTIHSQSSNIQFIENYFYININNAIIAD
jgi:hypothetical protein